VKLRKAGLLAAAAITSAGFVATSIALVDRGRAATGADVPSHETTASRAGPDHRVINVGDFMRGRTARNAIQAASDSAAPGDTVYFPGGRYELDAPFFFASGVNYVGDPHEDATISARGAKPIVIRQTPSHPLRNATVRSLHFDNIEMRLTGNETYAPVDNVTLQDCVFQNGRREVPWSSDYVWLTYTRDVTIDNCVFLRDKQTPGRGVVLARTRGSVIKDSYFGTTPSLEDGAPNGYFRTAINLTGYDTEEKDRNQDVVIADNVMRRVRGVACPRGLPFSCEDHAIYAWGARDVVVTGNYIDGWTNTGTGGAVKLRNGDDFFVVNNHFMTSGMIAYTYWHTGPRHLSHVLIEGNRLDLLGDGSPGFGISYRRSAEQPGRYPRLCQERNVENDIHIVGNTFLNGGSINLACADGREICAQGNAGTHLYNAVPSLRTAACDPPAGWDRPVAELLHGDFNGDGREDFIRQLRERPSGRLRWKAHLTRGDGFTAADWGGVVTVSHATARFGVQVGDFDGDHLDDITYRGACGSSGMCWRVQHSTGTSLGKPVVLGDPGLPGGDTVRLGIHAGDFTGDGLADLLLRGMCGRDRHACWTVLASRPDGSLAAKDFGDQARWDGTATEAYGFVVGDFNGDGRDDVAYRGLCKDAEPCIRFDESTGGGFVVGSVSEDLSFADPVSRHFGLHSADLNDDGADDISFFGRCGGSGRARLQYVLGGTVKSCQAQSAYRPSLGDT
jgi:hypothetical protein